LINNPAVDRVGPENIPPVEMNGVRYEQLLAGEGGELTATEISTGKRLWELVVYHHPHDTKLEADLQWIYFKSMSPDPDGRLRITNEAGKTYLVDVKTRAVTPL
jgi:hypothetical protein